MYNKLKQFIVSGLMVNTMINFIIGYPINITVAHTFGYYWAIVINTIISCIISIAYIWIYDHRKEDALAIEGAKSGKITLVKKKNRLIRFIEKYHTLGETSIVIICFSWRDPIITTLYFRTGNHLYDGLRGWKIKTILIASAIVTNVIWTSVLFTGQSAHTIIWHFFTNLFHH